MVIKMNKKLFIEELSKELKYPLEKCIIINNILENNFVISKSNKDKIIDELMNKLNIDYNEGSNIYEKAITIIKNEVTFKLKHPFKSQK